MKKKTTTPKSTKSQTTVNKEAFKMLAMEIGLNAACRRLGIPIPTGKSWARRGKWKLPKRTGGRPGRGLAASQLDANRTPIADALAQTHKEREAATRSQLEQAAHNWALAAAQAQPQVPTAAAFAAVIAGIAKLFGWDRPGATLTINSDKTVIVCDESRRTELIAQRQRLLAAEKPVEVRTVPAHEQKNEATGFDSSANQKPLQGYLGPVRENPWGPAEDSPHEVCEAESDNPDELSLGL